MKEINNYLMEITKKIFTVKTVIVFFNLSSSSFSV